jgi:hypothetical protein
MKKLYALGVVLLLLFSIQTVHASTLPSGCTATSAFSSTTGHPCATSHECAAGALYSALTGKPCGSTVTLLVGCISTTGYSSVTGQRCDSTATIVPPLPTTPTAVSQPENTTTTNTANINKQNALSVYNQILNEYTSLNTFITSDLQAMNNVNANMTALTNNPYAAAVSQATNQFIKLFTNGQAKVTPIVSATQSQLSQLESEPLSYFLTYQVSSDPAEPYLALNAYSGIDGQWLSSYNSWLSVLKQASTPIPTIPQPVSCSVQSPGTIGGFGSVTCSGGGQPASYCTFESPATAGGFGSISCH